MWWLIFWIVVLLAAAWWLTGYLGRRDLKKALGLEKVPTFQSYEELVKYHELLKDLSEESRKRMREIQRVIDETRDPIIVEKLIGELNKANRRADYLDRVRFRVLEFRKLPCY